MKKAIILIFFILAFSGVSFPISADLGEIGIGAKPLSLGRAYIGDVQDASAVFMNPAGLGSADTFGLMTMTSKLLDEVNYVSLGLSVPMLNKLTLGFGYINATMSGIPLTNLNIISGEVNIVEYGSTDYASSVMYLSLGVPLNVSRGILKNILVGASLKLYNQGFSVTTGSLEGAIGSGLDVDLGLKWTPRDEIALGAVARNVLPSNLGGKFTWKSRAEEGIASSIKIGSSIKVLGKDGLYTRIDKPLLWNTDLEMSTQTNSRPSIWHTGLELLVNPILALRCGVDQSIKAEQSGVGIDNNLTAGVGIKYKGFSFDYAYHQFGEITQNATHFFSLSYKGETETKKPEEIIKEKMQKIISTEIKTKKTLELKKFSDVGDGFWAKDPIEYLATLGIMSGYPDDTFKPLQPMTRAELAALLVKTKGFEVQRPDGDIFPDVNADHWAAPYISVAVRRKYMSGYPDGKFRPWQEISRAEAVVVFSKFAGLTIPEGISSNPFPDITRRHWAAPAISAAKQAGLLEYLSGSDFEPDKVFTRAEAAEIMSKTDFAKDKIKELLKK